MKEYAGVGGHIRKAKTSSGLREQYETRMTFLCVALCMVKSLTFTGVCGQRSCDLRNNLVMNL